MRKSKNRYFYHIFGAITLNVVWLEREFDAYKLSRFICPSNYYRFWDRARYLWKKSSFYHTPLHSTPLLGGFTSKYRHPLWYGKTRMVSLPMVKKIEDIFIRFGATHNVTDRRTDGRTDTAWQQRPRWCIASRGKNVPRYVSCIMHVRVATPWLVRIRTRGRVPNMR